MPISLETLRLPARRLPSMSTITMSEARIRPLLIQVGVTSRRSASRRTDRFPSVAATKPFSCSRRPNCTIARRCWRSLFLAILAILVIGKSLRGHVTARLGDLTTTRRSKYVKPVESRASPPGYLTAGRARRPSLLTLILEPSLNPIISSVIVSDFHYDLPPDRIAQEPLLDRGGSRLLHLSRRNLNRFNNDQLESWQDRSFREFPDLLRSDDLLVVNNTRVFPARLYGHRSGQRAQPLSPHNPAARDFLRGRIEVLLTRQVADNPNEWECLVRPGRKSGIGERLYFAGPPRSLPHVPPELEAEVTQRGSFGARRIRFAPVDDFFACIE